MAAVRCDIHIQYILYDSDWLDWTPVCLVPSTRIIASTSIFQVSKLPCECALHCTVTVAVAVESLNDLYTKPLSLIGPNKDEYRFDGAAGPMRVTWDGFIQCFLSWPWVLIWFWICVVMTWWRRWRVQFCKSILHCDCVVVSDFGFRLVLLRVLVLMMPEPDDDAQQQLVAGAIPASPVAPLTPTPTALPPLPMKFVGWHYVKFVDPNANTSRSSYLLDLVDGREEARRKGGKWYCHCLIYYMIWVRPSEAVKAALSYSIPIIP